MLEAKKKDDPDYPLSSHEMATSHHSDCELRSKLDGLTDDEILKIKLAARRYVSIARGMEPQDLFQDAYLRILDGRRKWPTNVSVLKMFQQTMRSIASETVTRKSSEVEVTMEDNKADALNVIVGKTPEMACIENEDAQRLIDSLCNDENEQFSEFVTYLCLGMKGRELAENLGITTDHLATLRRKLSRKYNRLLKLEI